MVILNLNNFEKNQNNSVPGIITKNINNINFIFCGALKEKNNILDIILEFKKIYLLNKNIYLTLCYNKIKGSINFQNNLINLIKENHDNIFFKFNLTNKEIQKIIQNSDIGFSFKNNDFRLKEYELYDIITIKNFDIIKLNNILNNKKLNVIKNLNINTLVKNNFLNYINILDENYDIDLNNIKQKFKINFIIYTYTCYNLINEQRKGNVENEINIMTKLTYICDVYYNDVYINDLLDINEYIKINELNNRLIKHKTDGFKYYDGYEIFKPSINYDLIFFRGDYRIQSLNLFKMLPEKKCYSHNYNKNIWKKNIIGFQTNVNNFLAKNKLLENFDTDNTINYEQYIIEPKYTFIKFQFIKKYNKGVEIENYHNLLSSKFLIGIIGNINKYTCILKFIDIFINFRKNFPNLNIKIIIISNEMYNNTIYDQYDFITVLFNLSNEKYLSLLKQLDLVLNTWCINHIIFSGSNKNLDCITMKIPLICPFSISYADILGYDYPLFYNVNETNTLIENINKIIHNSNNIIQNIKNRFSNIEKKYNNKILKLYYNQLNFYCNTNYNENLNIALGYVFSNICIGGVRRYLENIKENSTYNISLYPDYDIDNSFKQSNYNTLHMRNMRNYIETNMQQIIDKHDIFHSNVDPTFIKLCENAQKQGKLWIHTYHLLPYDPNLQENKQLLLWQKEINEALLNIANKADICISVSRWLVKEYNKLNINTIFIPNFIDTSLLRNIKRNKFKNTYKLNNYILFIGDESYRKNYVEFLKLANELLIYKFVLIGINKTKINIEKQYNIKLNNNIILLKSMSHDLCLEALIDCSILIITSLMEGLPTILLEGLYYEKPCIIPEESKWTEPFHNLNFIYKYNLGNINSLINKVNFIMNNYKELPEAKKYIIDNYSDEYIINKLDNLYIENYTKKQLLFKKRKILLLVYYQHYYFIDEIALKMKEDYNVLIEKWDNDTNKYLKLLQNCDIVFCEWGHENAKWFSNNIKPHQKLLIRIHRWELYTNTFFNIKWENVYKIIFISPYIQKIAIERCINYYSLCEKNFDVDYYINNNIEYFDDKNILNGWEHFNNIIKKTGGIPNFKQNLNLDKIKNKIDLSKKSLLIYNYVKSTIFNNLNKNNYKYNIGMIGIIPKLKRADIAIEIINYLIKKDKRYKLYLVSNKIEEKPWLLKNIKEVDYYNNLFNLIKKYNLDEHVIFENFTDKIHIWLQKINFLLSTSDIEGSHQAIAEAMASGTIPFIYGNALKKYKLDEIYPKEYCYYENTIDNLCENIIKYNNDDQLRTDLSIKCKLYCKNNFNIDTIYNSIKKILD